MGDVFSWDHLSGMARGDEIWNTFSITYLIVFVIGFLISVMLYNDVGRRIAPNHIVGRYLRRAGGWTMIPIGVGLFFLAIRIVEINPFSFGARIWMYISIVSVILTVVFLLWEYRVKYPSERAAYEQQKVKAQYYRPAASPSRRR